MTKNEMIDVINKLDIDENVKINCVLLLKNLHFNECKRILSIIANKLDIKRSRSRTEEIRLSKLLFLISEIDNYLIQYNCDFDDDNDAIFNY